MNVAWSNEALDELAQLAARLREISPAYETRLLERIFEASDRLAQFPESGRMVPEFGEPQVREVIVRPYRLLYSIGADGVEIHAVFHGSMKLDD